MIIWWKNFKLLYPAGAVMAASLILPKVNATEMVDCHHCKVKRLPKASELPLYEKRSTVEYELIESKSTLEDGISVTRKSLSKYIVMLDGAWKQALEAYHTGLAHSKSTYDYVTEDESVFPRVIAIASGGLLGLLISVRAGIFKKVLYTTSGITVTAAACYPKDAKHYFLTGVNVTKEKTNQVLKDSGYDVEKITISTKEKLGTYNFSVQDLSKKMREWINKVYPVEKMGKLKDDKSEEGDPGQSNPVDKDLYTTRK